MNLFKSLVGTPFNRNNYVELIRWEFLAAWEIWGCLRLVRFPAPWGAAHHHLSTDMDIGFGPNFQAMDCCDSNMLEQYVIRFSSWQKWSVTTFSNFLQHHAFGLMVFCWENLEKPAAERIWIQCGSSTFSKPYKGLEIRNACRKSIFPDLPSIFLGAMLVCTSDRVKFCIAFALTGQEKHVL